MVHPRDAQQDRAHEGDGENIAFQTRASTELVSGRRPAFFGGCRRFQQQSKIGYQKILRISYSASLRNCAISQSWQTTSTRSHPQILLKRHQKDFNALPQLSCPSQLVMGFGSQAEQLDEKIELNSAAIEALTKLRDTLLPKLLSGGLCIPDAEKLVAKEAFV